VVEPLLPDSLAGGEAEGEGQRAGAALGFREVFLEGEGLDAAVSREGWEIIRTTGLLPVDCQIA
jgi:hypothetical protein